MAFPILQDEDLLRAAASSNLIPESSGITRADAERFIERRKSVVAGLLNSQGQPSPIQMLHAETFDATEIIRLIELTDPSHIRMYVGVNDNNELCLILATIQGGKEVLPPYGDSQDKTKLVEFGIPCPPKCNKGLAIAPFDLSDK